MTALITGDTGFIGSHMMAFLKEKDVETRGYSRSNGYNLFDVKTLNREFSQVGSVYHFAAEAKPGESVLHPKETIKENIEGTLNILEACRKYDLTLFFPSSCEIYGDYLESIKETDEFKPTNPYSASKTALDRLCYTYHKCYGLDIKILRIFNPYGPRQQLNKIIPTFYRQAKNNQPITVYGDGSDTRDYVYVTDIIEGFWLANKLPKGEAVNLSTNIATSNKQVAEIIIDELNSSSEIRFVDYPKAFGGIKNQVGSNKKAKRLLNWTPNFVLRTGIKETIKWLNHQENLK